MLQGWKKYLENELNTGSSTQITVLAYEKCISELMAAEYKIENFKYKESEMHFEKVGKIFEELLLQLNHEHLPELAAKIEELYIWIIQEVQKQKLRKDKEMIKPIIKVINNLLEGFKGAIENEG